MAREVDEVARATWAALEGGGSYSLDQLELLTDVPAARILRYLGILLTHGYVRLAGLQKAHSGEAIPLFKLIIHTGPEPPHVDEKGTFMDPNVRAREEARGRIQKRGLLTARFRVAAEQFRRPFTRYEIAAAIAVSEAERKRFKGTIHRLIRDGDLIRHEDGTLEYQASQDSVAERLRYFLKTCVGLEVTIKQMAQALGCEVRAPDIRLARERMEAEGYCVRFIKRDRPPVQYYCIEPSDPEANGV